jgi:hypothetical protein
MVVPVVCLTRAIDSFYTLKIGWQGALSKLVHKVFGELGTPNPYDHLREPKSERVGQVLRLTKSPEVSVG